MRRVIVAVVAAALALGPTGFAGLSHGAPSAHADLGWCPECDEAAAVIGPLDPGYSLPAPPSMLPSLRR